MNLLDIISPEAVKVPLLATTKRAAIEELVDLLIANKQVGNPAELNRVVWDREMQRSTGIGEGLAIPHGKSPALNHLVAAMGKPAEPLEFDAIDKKPVRLIVLLVSPPNKTADHIQALGKISRFMVDPGFRQAAYNAESAEDLYDLFKQAELARSTA